MHLARIRPLAFRSFLETFPSFLEVVRVCVKWVLCLAAFGFFSSDAIPQSESNSQSEIPNQGLRLNGLKLVPYSRPRAGRYLTIGMNVSNVSTVEQAGLIVARIDRAPNFQAATEVHVAPGESFRVDMRLQVPSNFAPNTAFEINASLNSLGAGQRVILGPTGHPILESLRLKVDDSGIITGIILEDNPPRTPEWYWPTKEFSMSYELMTAVNFDEVQPRRMLSIFDGVIPSQMADWEALDAIVIGREGPLRDAAAMAAMSQWLADGGRAWIMVDKINKDNLNSILSDGMSCQTIDDIDLMDFDFEINPSIPINTLARKGHVDLEDPIRMRRVIQSGGTVVHTINGFPASISFEVGNGRILVTTLEAGGWLRKRIDPTKSLNDFSNFQADPWAKGLFESFFESRDSRSPIERAEVNYPLKHIGNPVLDRTFVLSILFGFCALLLVACGVCWYAGSLVRLGWIVPAMSVGATVPLWIALHQLRRDIPDTSSHLQIIEAQPGSRTIQAREWTTTYKGGADGAILAADGDAIVTWPNSVEQTDLRRLKWNDLHKWQLSSSGWPRGLWQLQSRFKVPLQRLDVIAKLDRQGLSLEMPSELKYPLEDSVLLYSSGDPAICGRIEQAATARVPTGHATLDQSWIASTLVSDEQSRRDDVYRQFPSRNLDMAYPSFPALLGWTKLWDSPFSWSDARDERGAALVVLPVKLLPVATGEEVTVPHTVIRVETPLSKENVLSSAFSNRSGLWSDETTLARTVPLRFTLPKQVCPFKATEIVIDLQLRAPQRDVRITSLAVDVTKPVADLRSPLNAIRIVSTDPAVLADAEDGSLDFIIEVSKNLSQNEDAISYWQIDYVRLSASGRVLER